MNQARILVIDDNPEIHKDFQKVLALQGHSDDQLAALESDLFGEEESARASSPDSLNIEIDAAFQGEEGINMVLQAARDDPPYCAAFVDVRMPPGIDGVQTIKRIWQHLPDLPCVICTAFSDYQWDEISRELHSPGNLLILKKPFDAIEVLQIVKTLVEKRELAIRAQQYKQQLESRLALLQQAQRELQEKNVQLEQARKTAEIHSQAKGQFLANMSHELRTPLNGVIGWTELLLGTNLDEQQLKCARTIRSSGMLLLELVDEILDFSKIEAGKLELEKIDFNVVEIIESIVYVLSHRCRTKGLILSHFIDPDVPRWMRGDQGRIRQVLLNLANNAIKFTEAGEVEVHVGVEEQLAGSFRIRFSVRDTGIGIPVDRRDRLFQLFSQVDSSTTRKFGGTGLGLAISKQLCELMGGEIDFESTAGEGTTFWFTLPLEKPASPHAVAAHGGWRMEGLDVHLIDGNPFTCNIVSAQIANWGCRVTTSADVHQAEQYLKTLHDKPQPKLIVVDLESVTVPGGGLSHLLKHGDRGESRLLALIQPGIPLTADVSRAAGFSGIITKPATQSDFYNCLVKIMDSNAPAKKNNAQPVKRQAPVIPRSRHPKAKILLAEDNEVNRNLATEILKQCGLQCDVVCDGKQAVAHFARTPYDLVLMDVHMPEMDGLQATRAIRSDVSQFGALAASVPIIALTASVLPEDHERCYQAGMNAHLTKPFMPRVLVDTIDQWLDATCHVPGNPGGTAAGPSESETSIFDHQALAEVCLGDENLLQYTLQTLLVRGEQDVQRIEAAAAAGNVTTVSRSAHSLCGAAATVGAKRLADVAQNLEIATKASTVPQPELVEQVRERWRELSKLIEGMLEQKTNDGAPSVPSAQAEGTREEAISKPGQGDLRSSKVARSETGHNPFC